jgi:hypothetical protein
VGGLLDLPEELLEDAWFLPLDHEVLDETILGSQ